jgi:glycosyltransferase involved in cell wall biosynthesis
MNRSILIVTPFFAPQSHAAVFRAYKLAKYLPRFGWKPYVLTVDHNYLYNEDPTLMEDLPDEVEVSSARYIEPTMRGLRMAMGGRDRTFAALKREGQTAPSEGSTGPMRRTGVPPRARDYILKRWAQTPDAHWTWYGPAVRAARQLIRQHDIPLVFTSADPFTSHRIGRTLQLKGCRWVADLRDPHAYCGRMHSRFPAVYARQRQLERDAVLRADAVTVASSAISMILADSYGYEILDRTHFIPTGLDEDLISACDQPRPRPFPYLLFSGEFLPEYGPEFLEIFGAALQRPGVRASGVKLLVVGRLDANGPQLAPIVRRLGLESHVEFVDHLPQRELYRLLQGAEAGVLLSSRRSHWWCLYAKLVDYIAMRKTVVSVLPDPSEARTRLNEAGLGLFLDGDREACVGKLADFLSGRASRPIPSAAACDRFLASEQVRSFAGLFEGLLSDGHSPPESASGGAAAYVDLCRGRETMKGWGDEPVAPRSIPASRAPVEVD